ncbi:MAG: hypothetical protein J5I94_18295 [Phaeodactylibacter sp.]|nr:hypothetical protein [Phaeodactylibacter sp.]
MEHSPVFKELIRVGEEILESRKEDEYGNYFWISPKVIDEEIYFQAFETVYSGVSGIILFFIRLYEITNDDKYRQAIIKSVGWLYRYCRENPTDNYAFYTGRMGVVYTLLKVYESLAEKAYLEKAEELAIKCGRFIELRDPPVYDLLNGTAGALLGLLFLYEKKQSQEILQLIEQYVNHLLDGVKWGRRGIFWDITGWEIWPLTGFSHGSSGIGYVFIQLAKLFDNAAYYWIAEQSFNYENQFYSKKNNNWKDFRKPRLNSEANMEKYGFQSLEDLSYFTRPKYMNAWCHGSPGIALTRFELKSTQGSELWKNDLKKSIQSTIQSLNSSHLFSHCLCHGTSGNAMVIIHCAEELNGETLTIEEQLEATIARQIKYCSSHGRYQPGLAKLSKDDKDYSLFMGLAGVGYFYVSYLDRKESSIIKPSVAGPIVAKGPLPGSLFATESSLFSRCTKNVFRRTLSLLEYLAGEEEFSTLEQSLFANNRDEGLEPFVERIQAVIDKLPDSKLIKEVFDFELKNWQLPNTSHGNFYLSTLHFINRKNFSQAFYGLSSGKIKDSQLILKSKPASALFRLEWNWLAGHWGAQEADRGQEVFIFSTFDGKTTKQYSITRFNYFLLSQIEIRQEISVFDLAELVFQELEIENQVDREAVGQKVLDQTAVLARNNFIQVAAIS